MWGLEHSEHLTTTKKTVSSRLARYSYGIVVCQPFDSSKHLLEDRIMHPSKGVWYANNQMLWLIKRVSLQFSFHATWLLIHQSGRRIRRWPDSDQQRL